MSAAEQFAEEAAARHLSLAEHIEHEVTPADEPRTDEEREAWKVSGDRTAGWCLIKLAQANARAARIADEYNTRAEALKTWRDHALKAVQRDVTFFEGALGDYHRRNLEPQLAEVIEVMSRQMPDAEPHDVFLAAWEKVKDKTYPLPDGALTARRTPDSVEVVDEAAFLAWARDTAPELTKVTPAVAAIKKLPRKGLRVVTKEGEVVPGVQTRPGTINYGAAPAAVGELPAWLPVPSEDE